MSDVSVLGVDLGASSVKIGLATYDGSKLSLVDEQVFRNRPIHLPTVSYWDVFSFYNAIKDALSYFSADYNIDSIAVVSWGSTYGLLDEKSRLIEPVYHYRDKRSEKSMDEIYKIITPEDLFKLTACQPNRTYALAQLFAYIEHGDREILERAETLLFLPDLLSYFLSGTKGTEITITGTTGLLNAELNNWSYELFDLLNIPRHMIKDLIKPGEIRGPLLSAIKKETGAKDCLVTTGVGHDTFSGTLAIPDYGKNKLYLSMGTNTNMGLELDDVIISEFAFESGFKYSVGFDNQVYAYRDFAGFWLIDQLLISFAGDGRSYTYDDILELTKNPNYSGEIFDVESPEFADIHGDIRVKINEQLKSKGLKTLEEDYEFACCIFRSIAARISHYKEKYCELIGQNVEGIYAINGGSRNTSLMQMIADAVDMPVYAGLPQGTLIGNLLSQLYALGHLNNVSEIRELSANSFEMKEYLPGDPII
ncbi:MAG: rhamnulokinase [Saccharofermentanales bacterium]